MTRGIIPRLKLDPELVNKLKIAFPRLMFAQAHRFFVDAQGQRKFANTRVSSWKRDCGWYGSRSTARGEKNSPKRNCGTLGLEPGSAALQYRQRANERNESYRLKQPQHSGRPDASDRPRYRDEGRSSLVHRTNVSSA